MDDRELLELAAKAAGIAIDYRRGSDAFYYDDHETGHEQWKPLDDDGQALRLVIDLGLHIKMYYDHVDVVIFNKAINPVSMQFELQRNGKHIATRRAIVLAAAEIGKKQNEMR